MCLQYSPEYMPPFQHFGFKISVGHLYRPGYRLKYNTIMTQTKLVHHYGLNFSLHRRKLADVYSTEEYTAVIFECIETDKP